MKYQRNVLITGGAGFIGSHVVRLFVNKYPEYQIINVDKLTYAENPENLMDIQDKPNYRFIKADVCNYQTICQILSDYKVDRIIHLAAERHVDRSIENPFVFTQTNMIGTLSLLLAAKNYWQDDYTGKLFYHLSTYDPQSPYSEIKDSSDHFVRAFYDMYGLPAVLTNCSNNYGPYQFPEKLIPLSITNILNGKPLPVYGKGEHVSDWLYVVDHARAVDLIFHKGELGDSYYIGGFNEWKNIDLIKAIIKTVDRLSGNPEGTSDHLITYLTDRTDHDLHYVIDSTKLKNELGWEPSLQFEEGIEKTVRWYLDNKEWMKNKTSGEYNK